MIQSFRKLEKSGYWYYIDSLFLFESFSIYVNWEPTMNYLFSDAILKGEADKTLGK